MTSGEHTKGHTHEDFIADVTAHRQFMGESVTQTISRKERQFSFEKDESSSGPMFTVFNEHGTRVTYPYISQADAALIHTAVNTYPAVEKLIRTLEFYADPAAWKKKNDHENLVAIPDFYFELDFGMEAKDALTRFREAQAGGER